MPPKSCSNFGLFRITEVPSEQKTMRAGNGLVFRSICSNCNNALLAPIDKDLLQFVNYTKTFLQLNENNLQTASSYNVTINSRNIVRCIAGHLIAAFEPPENLSEPRKEPLVPYLSLLHRLFAGENLYQHSIVTWIHDYPTINIYPFAGAISIIGSKRDPNCFSVLSFFPLGFMIIDRRYYESKLPFLRLRTDTEQMQLNLSDLPKNPENFPLSTLQYEVVSMNSQQAFTAKRVSKLWL